MGDGFAGFPPEAFDFYERLEADNSKTFWSANRADYERLVRAPMAALCDELAGDGAFHLYRPYNDLRFARGRPPYKTHQGAFSRGAGAAGHYLQISADGLAAAAGCYTMAADQLARFRAAVDDPAIGSEAAAIADELATAGYEIGAMDTLKTAPRGYPKDHPRIELLRRKGLMAWRSWPVAGWMHGPKVVDRVRAVYADAAPLCAWLDRHVGPSVIIDEPSAR